MTQQPQQSTAQPGAVPAQITLEDFIEAVSRGVARALTAQQDEVSGYAMSDPMAARPPIVIGLWLPPTAATSLSGQPPTIESR